MTTERGTAHARGARQGRLLALVLLGLLAAPLQHSPLAHAPIVTSGARALHVSAAPAVPGGADHRIGQPCALCALQGSGRAAGLGPGAPVAEVPLPVVRSIPGETWRIPASPELRADRARAPPLVA